MPPTRPQWVTAPRVTALCALVLRESAGLESAEVGTLPAGREVWVLETLDFAPPGDPPYRRALVQLTKPLLPPPPPSSDDRCDAEAPAAAASAGAEVSGWVTAIKDGQQFLSLPSLTALPSTKAPGFFCSSHLTTRGDGAAAAAAAAAAVASAAQPAAPHEPLRFMRPAWLGAGRADGGATVLLPPPMPPAGRRRPWAAEEDALAEEERALLPARSWRKEAPPKQFGRSMGSPL